MGERGPIPKRPEERRRRNKDSQPEIFSASHVERKIPDGDPTWHPRALSLYVSLATSGQAEFYEPSDWEMAAVACELLSEQLYGDKKNANMIAVIDNIFGRLLATEGDRRRARLILEHPDQVEEPAAVALMAKYRKAAS